jgi:hypothetical protein
MMSSDKAIATDRLRRALLAFQATKSLFLNAHRRPKTRPQTEVIAYWAGPGRQVKADLRLAAAEVDAAFLAFTAAGLVTGGTDRSLIAEAQRYWAEGKP